MQYLTRHLFHYFLLRLYSVLRAKDASSRAPTGTGATTPETRSNTVQLALGLTFGLLTLAIAVIGAFCLRRRRRRKSVDLLASSYAPRSSIPPTQGERRSRWSQGRKRPAQTTQAHALGSTPLSGVSPAAVPTTSISIAELELPPSYESHVRTGGVAMAK